MSKINTRHVYTSESVAEGHPDKVCDQISDAVLDACLAQDPASRVACETLVTANLVVVAGEITTTAKVNYEKLVRGVIRDIGYTTNDVGFSARDAAVQIHLHTQSPDIAQGVTATADKEQGAGDQGMMYGYATDETPALMPAPLYYAHLILEELARRRKGPKAAQHRFLRPDAKSQVSILYDRGLPRSVETVVVSHQHTPDMAPATLEKLVRQVVTKVIPAKLRPHAIRYFVNPTGRFVVGGPAGDSGLTGRKIIVDTYGGVGSHGGGAFSGKDPSKVDRSAAYMARYVAKNIVAAGLAKKCEVQVAYAIGIAQPVSVNVDTYGTGRVEDAELQALLETGEFFDLRPARIIATLGLKTPKGWSYREAAAYGHFGRAQFPWEKTDRAAALRRRFGVKR